MKVADYSGFGGARVEYDECAPCWMCGEPVVEASMGGTVICPWCDCGKNRDGSKLTARQLIVYGKSFERNKKLADAPTVGMIH